MRLLQFAAAAAVLFSCTISQAGYITSNGTVQMQSNSTSNGGPNPPLIHIQEIGHGAGQLWTNQITGGAFQPGNTVRTVGAISVSDLVNGSSLQVFLPPDNGPAHFIFAVEGVTVSPGVASFSIGSIYVAPSVAGNGGLVFDATDPLTYNFGNSFAKFDLGPKAGVTSGQLLGIDPAGNVGATASEVNLSAVFGPGTSGAGVFAFVEDLLFTPTGIDPGIAPFDGADWIRDVVLPTSPSGTTWEEGIVAFTDQTQDIRPELLDVGGVVGQVAALDAIGAAAGFTGLFSEGGFDPRGLIDPVQTGDFSADLSSETYITVHAVPEPGSMAVFAIFGGAIAFRRKSRRNS